MPCAPRRSVALLLALVFVAASCSSDGDDTSAAESTDTTAAADTTEAPETAEADDSAEATEAAETTDESETDEEADTTEAPAVGEGCQVDTGIGRISSEAGGPIQGAQVYVPTTFDGTLLPVVINWHGLGSDGPQQALFTDYEALAEREGFIAVHPTGTPGPGDNRNSWELIQLDIPNRDDIAFANDLIDQLIADFCVDESRVYSTGMSNGGFFTSRLLCDMADRIAAGVSVAGLSHPDECDPSRAVPFMAFHGTADLVVPFAGGESSLLEGEATEDFTEFFAQVMPDEFSEFAADFGCELEPEVSEIGVETIRYDYLGCDDDVPLIFYEVTEGGHTWPSSPLGPLLLDTLGYTTTDVDATADGWAFMSQFSLTP